MILTAPVSQYIDQLRSRPDRVLAEMETRARHDGIPVVVPATGRLLEVLALARGARRALEVGTAIGVSTLYIARGLATGGRVVSFEIDPERHAAAQDYLERAGVADRVELRLQDARDGPGRAGGASSTSRSSTASRPNTATTSMPCCRCWPIGAVLVVDNVLMDGRVAEGDGSERISRRGRSTSVCSPIPS